MLLRALLLGSVFLSSISLAVAGSPQGGPESQTSPLTLSEYVARLDGLASSVKELARSEEVPKLLSDIPPVWRVVTPQRTFEISSEWLRQGLSEWQSKPSQEVQERIFTRLQIARAEAASFGNSAKNVSLKRAILSQILASPEFQNIHGPTWLDQLKQRILEWIVNLLGKVFRSSSIPTVGNVVIYGLMTLALLAVAYWMYRTVRNNAGATSIVPSTLNISSKGWKTWMQEARQAAETGNWRDAVHLGYWCGISFLEAQELWRPDRARTPREYLRLLPAASQHREALGTLTRSFELVWYGTKEADATAFSETLAQLERLGCQSN